MDEIKEMEACVVKLAQVARGIEAWGTAAGARAFASLNEQLRKAGTGTLVVLDYHGIVRTDVSYQREAIVETLRKHRPRLIFIAQHFADEDVLANLSVALEASGERMLVRDPPRGPRIVGRQLGSEHLATLGLVQLHPGFTSAQLTGPPHGLESSTASARLTALWKAGLLGRTQGAAPSGGVEYRYYPIK